MDKMRGMLTIATKMPTRIAKTAEDFKQAGPRFNFAQP
jgi:hypothetical protein